MRCSSNSVAVNAAVVPESAFRDSMDRSDCASCLLVFSTRGASVRERRFG